MDRADPRYWLALSRVKGIDSIALSSLVDSFGSAKEIFERAHDKRLDSFSVEFCRNVRAFDRWAQIDDELARAEKENVRVVPFDGLEYPGLLKAINDPPLALFVKGDMGRLKSLLTIGIVGTRRPSHYGIKMAETLSRDLALMGVGVISGLARGCDTAAHRGALAGGGFTAAILGTGVDIAYPKENKKLSDEIAEKGALISEYPLSTPPVPYNFPRRNRIISGLSKGVVVVEAPVRSGSLMTARLALDYNREVFAVPGQATSIKSSGANKLIKEGAFLVESAADIAQAFGIFINAGEGEPESDPGPELDGEEKLVWKAIGEPKHIDAVATQTGLLVSKVSSILLGLEFKGLVEKKPGNMFMRKNL